MHRIVHRPASVPIDKTGGTGLNIKAIRFFYIDHDRFAINKPFNPFRHGPGQPFTGNLFRLIRFFFDVITKLDAAGQRRQGIGQGVDDGKDLSDDRQGRDHRQNNGGNGGGKGAGHGIIHRQAVAGAFNGNESNKSTPGRDGADNYADDGRFRASVCGLADIL